MSDDEVGLKLFELRALASELSYFSGTTLGESVYSISQRTGLQIYEKTDKFKVGASMNRDEMVFFRGLIHLDLADL